MAKATAAPCLECIHLADTYDECWHAAAAPEGSGCELEYRCIRNKIKTDTCASTGGSDPSDCSAGPVPGWQVQQKIRFGPGECDQFQTVQWHPWYTVNSACNSQSCDIVNTVTWQVACDDFSPQCGPFKTLIDTVDRGVRLECGTCPPN